MIRKGAGLAGMLAAVIVIVVCSSVPADPPADRKPAKDREERQASKEKRRKKDKPAMPALSFTMKDIDGKRQDLRQYEGNVVLMVNVASRCGLTPQYKDLQALYEKYANRGFVVLGFPANEFGAQEPGSDSEIREFCTTQYDVTFPMFSKVVVKGEGVCKLYKYLTDTEAKHGKGGEIEWNFTKFLIDRKGEVVERYHPRRSPADAELVAKLEELLETEIPADSALGQKLKQAKEKEKKKGKDERPGRKDKPAKEKPGD